MSSVEELRAVLAKERAVHEELAQRAASLSQTTVPWQGFETEFDALNSGELTLSDFIAQYEYLRSESVSLRALALAVEDEKRAIAHRLETRIMSLSIEKSDLQNSRDGAFADPRAATPEPEPFSEEAMLRRELAILKDQLGDERARVARVVAEKQAIESKSEQLMADMLAKLRTLEAEHASGEATKAAAGIEEVSALRATVMASEHATVELHKQRVALEQELHAEKQARFQQVQVRLSAENDLATVSQELESQAEALRRLEAESSAAHLMQSKITAAKTTNARLRQQTADVTRDRDDLRVQSQSARTELAEAALRVERAQLDARRTIKRMEKKLAELGGAGGGSSSAGAGVSTPS